MDNAPESASTAGTMPRIPKTPSPSTFAATWSTDFKEAVTKAAGKDGRLTLSEATKLAARPDADRLFADNAVNYLKATGKQSVSVEVLAKAAHAYAQRAAEVAAGPDKKVSLADGAKLPDDLKEDFFFLRGKSTPATPAVPGADGTVAVLAPKLEAAVADLWVMSETDAKLKVLKGPQLNGAPITADVVRSAFSAQHDAVFSDVMWVDPADLPLATRTAVEERSASEFLGDLAELHDPSDPVAVATSQKFAALKTLLERELTDLKVYRFGEINISTFIVGRTRSGELAGLLTGQVET